jgi:hypothetical protein
MQTTQSCEVGPRGIGGWLLLFILGLTIFFPLATVYRMVNGYNQVYPYLDRFPGLVAIGWIDILLSSALICYSIYAGVQLWRVRPKAVKAAKRMLLMGLTYSGGAIFLVAAAGLPPERTIYAVAKAFVNFVQTVIGVAIWYSYLNRSKRVRATYTPPVGA